jgi:hypothetical protein
MVGAELTVCRDRPAVAPIPELRDAQRRGSGHEPSVTLPRVRARARVKVPLGVVEAAKRAIIAASTSGKGSV